MATAQQKPQCVIWLLEIRSKRCDYSNNDFKITFIPLFPSIDGMRWQNRNKNLSVLSD